MLENKQVLLKAMALIPAGAATIGFVAAAFLHLNSLNSFAVSKARKPNTDDSSIKSNSVTSYLLETSPLSTPSSLAPFPKPLATPSTIPINSIKPIPTSYQSKVFSNVPVSPLQKVVALTFDDGPLDGPTQDILNILDKNHIKATFFLIGQNAKNNPDLVKKIFSDGDAIGNHSWTHPYNRQTKAGAQAEIEKTSAEIASITGVRPNLFRPPGGIMHNGLAEYAKSQKMGIVLWSADSIDYRAHSSASRLLSNIFRDGVKPGSIILMHDGGAKRTNTIQALPILIARLKKEAFRFVTIPELIDLDSKNSAKNVPLAQPHLVPSPVNKTNP